MEAWSNEYRAVTDTDDYRQLPKGLSGKDHKLHSKDHLLIPAYWVLDLCKAWHQHMVNPGINKQAHDILEHFALDDIDMRKALTAIKKGCAVYKACKSG